MDESNVLKGAKFIEANLDQPLDLKMIARRAGVSPYHFHRLFQGCTGDNPMEYVRKRRLTVAATRLLEEKTRILDIAIDACFESQEAFSRAFKKNFEATPGEFRKNGHKKHMRSRYPIDEEILKHLSKGITMKPEIKRRDSFHIIGMARDFDPDNKHEIGQLWGDFVAKLPSLQARIGDEFYGVSCGWPTTDGSMKNGKFNYAACVEVESISVIPKGLLGREIPAGEYAVFLHTGSIGDIHKTIDYIWGSWLPKSDYSAREAPDFERYDHRFDDQTMTGEFEIWIPVQPK